MNGTKGKMAEAFKELVCKKSFQKITISDIAKESAMTRENFYYHFRDKYDIMHWIFEQQVAAQLPEDEEPFEMWFNALFCNTCEDYKYYRKLIKSLSAEEIRSDLYPLFERRVRLLVQDCLDDSVWNLRKEKEDLYKKYNVPYIGIEKDDPKDTHSFRSSLLQELQRKAIETYGFMPKWKK